MNKNTPKKSTKGGKPKNSGSSTSNQPRQARKNQSNSQKGNPKQVSVASAYATGSVSKPPNIRQSRDNCRIIHRELISSIVGTADFNILAAQSFPLNPGMAVTFPWLSTMARCWEMYRFHKLKFEYFTRTGSQTPGSCMLIPDYDPSDPAPVSEQIASAFEDCCEDAPWKDFNCNLSASRLNQAQPFKTVRTDTLEKNLDIKTYDSGNLFVATTDGTAVNWGKLWVEYDVEFKIPQLPSQGAQIVLGGRIVGGGTLSDGNPLGDAPVLDPESKGLAVDNASVVTLTQKGTYLVTIFLQGVNITGVSLIPVGTTAVIFDAAVINTTGSRLIVHYRCVSTTINATLTLSAIATSIGVSDFVVGSDPLDSIS